MSKQEILLPGFVDLQVNGFMGVDFSSSDLTEESFRSACRAVIERGTALFLPTVITSSEEVYRQNLSLIARVSSDPEFRRHIPGIHLEGPFLSPEEGAAGAHNPAWVRTPDCSFLDKLLEWADGSVKLLTIAAERDGAAELCRHAVRQGITVSLGHQMAMEEETGRLADAGARALTHLGNGIPQQLDRHHNPVWAGLAEDRLTAMFIPDGHHLPATLIKIMIRCKGATGVVVVSDASPVAGLDPGHYRTLGNDVILEPSGRLWNPGTGYLVGSSATMLDCMNHLASLQLVAVEELIRCGTTAPLNLIGLDPEEMLKTLPSGVSWNGVFSIVNR